MPTYKVIFEANDRGIDKTLTKINNDAKKLDATFKKLASTKVGNALSRIKLPANLTAGLERFRRGIDAIDRSVSRIRARMQELSLRALLRSTELIGRGIGRSLRLGIDTGVSAFRKGLETIRNLATKTALITGAAITGILYKLSSNVNASLNSIDEIADAAASIGTLPLGLQTARFQAGKAGIEPGTIDMGLKTLQAQLGKGLGEFEDLQKIVTKALGKQAWNDLNELIKNSKDTVEAYVVLNEAMRKVLESGKVRPGQDQMAFII